MQTKVFMPFVRFETQVEETRNEDGHIVRKNKYYVYITPAGGKDEVMKVAEDWIIELRNKALTRGPFDSAASHYEEWHRHYSKGFAEYKNGEEMTMDGTPLRACMAFMKSEVAQAEAVKIFSLEQLAGCNDEALRNMGVGGRSLKNKANEILATTDKNRGAEKIISLELKIEQLEERIMAMLENGHKEPAKRGPKPKVKQEA